MLHLPLDTVNYILNQFMKNLSQYSLKTYDINSLEKVLVIEDSLVLYIGKILEDPCTVCENVKEMYAWTKNNNYMNMPSKDEDYYLLHIEELTYNNLGFKYNHTKFIREMVNITEIDCLGIDITYNKFKGYTRLYWCPEQETLVEQIQQLVPELRLRERYESWEGIHYYFIILEIRDINGKIEYAVAYTNQKPHNYIISKGRKWIKYGLNGNDDIRMNKLGFCRAFNSWKGKSRQYRLEEYLRYTFREKNFREKDEAWRYADELLDLAYNNHYLNEEKSTYKKPINKWVSEELVYNIVKKLYKDFAVIYQHRPFFLKSDIGGQMSYDVFISGLDIAIEYQGKQHFQPIEYFGGEETFKRTQERDKLKKELSIQNGITLIYINYDETITEQLIRNKINNNFENTIKI